MRLIGHDSVRQEVVSVLQELGVLQIADLTDKNPGLDAAFLVTKQIHTEELEQKLNEIQYLLDFIARFEQPKKSLLEGFVNPKATITEDEVRKIVDAYDYRSVYERARALETELAAIRSELSKLEAQRQELLPWADANIAIEQMRSTALVAFIAGKLEKSKVEGLKSKVNEAFGGLVSIEGAGEQGNEVYVYAVMPVELEARFLELGGEYSFERLPALFATLPQAMKGLPKDILLEIERRIAEIAGRRERLVEHALALGAEKPKLQALYDYLRNEFLKGAVQGRFVGSSNTFVLEGWVRASDLKSLESSLREKTEEVHIAAIEAEPGERPPVVLENKPLFRPAEVVVRLFGLPQPKELDPTPFVAPFFALFFGLALTDAGYGLSLVLIFSLLKRKFKSEAFRRFANLLIMGGVVAVIGGALTGGWFGPELVNILPFLKTFYVFDVSGAQGLIAFLGFAVMLGFVQVLLGHLLEFYDKVRSARLWDALWGEGTWVLFLLGLGLFAGIGLPPMLGLPGLPTTLTPLATTLLLIGLFSVLFFSRVDTDQPLNYQLPWLVLLMGLMLMLKAPGPSVLWQAIAAIGAIWAIAASKGSTLGRKLLSVLGRIGAGLFRLYGATGFMGDTLSYARIMALGIATGLIAMSVNTFATVLGGLLPSLFGLPKAVGILVAVLVVVVGQPFSLVINSLSAFVHSARLQYVEFFTKFYESGGDRFKPFAKETTFYEVKKS